MSWSGFSSAFDVPSSSQMQPYQLNLSSLPDSITSSQQMQWIIQMLSELKDQIALTQGEIKEIKDEAKARHQVVEQGFRDAVQAVMDLSQVVSGLQVSLNVGASGAPQLLPQAPPPPQPLVQPPTQPNLGGMKLAKPDKFDGTKHNKATDFRIACSLFLRMVHATATPDQQVNFIMSYLEGTACEWLQPHLDQEIIQGTLVPWLHNVQLFWQEFEKRFGEINRVENYRSKLQKLMQTKSIQEYLQDFQSYAAPLNYNDETLQDMFYEGLKSEIKNTTLLQDFDPLNPITMFEVLTDHAL
jgi:hypothetical protein